MQRRPVEPAGEARRILDGVDLSRDLQEHLLAGVLGVLGMTEHLAAERVDGVLMLLEQPGQRGLPRLFLVVQEQLRR